MYIIALLLNKNFFLTTQSSLFFKLFVKDLSKPEKISAEHDKPAIVFLSVLPG